jgi:hypothetical protein
LHLVTVTDFARSDDRKKVVWLMARQHAWETGTSFALEGALRFVLSADPAAQALRERTVFKFVPMMDPDGCAEGQVRFNAHGFDVNRHWDEVDLRDPQWLRKMPEIWYVKKAIRDAHAVQRIDLLINLHNTKTEYIETMVNDAAGQALFRRFFDTLVAETMFDPTRPLILLPKSSTTVVVWPEFGVPAALIELRTTSGQKSARRPTGEHRMKFGAQLITTMARVVQ